MPAEPIPDPSAGEPPPRRSRQATISDFDAGSGTGAVLFDTGQRANFPATAFQAGGLRLLRLGQRVRLDYDGDEVCKVTLITMP